jgi:hydroxymethylpyrimidine/phosphomethylpyrimidine kinase
MAHDQGIALVGVQKAGEHGDGCALTSAIGTEQTKDLSSPDVKAHALDGVDVAKVFVQILHLDG